APAPRLPDAGGGDRRGRRAPGSRASPGADPHGHPAPRHRRYRRARPASQRPGHSRGPGDRGDGVGDDARPSEDHGRRLRRLPDQADQPARVPGCGRRRRGRPPMTPPILVMDDTAQNVKLLADLLTAKGYRAVTAASGAQALAAIERERPDLVLLDVVMPEMSGYEVCRKIRDNPATAMLPVVMVTALDPTQERVKGIEAGADDFLTKPINQPELLARVRSLLRIKTLHDELSELNHSLEHPVPVPNPAERAIRMTLAMRESVTDLLATWRKRGFALDFGAGLAQGYATIGAIGFEGRVDYGAIGTVTNLAARLCGEARPGQILVSQRLLTTVEALVEAEAVGELSLKGFVRPVTAFNVLRLRS